MDKDSVEYPEFAIRQVDLAACRKLASAALELASPREVRDLVSASKK